MHFEIDQSGKIEQTNLDTVIAFSDGGSFSLLLKKSEKRKIKKYFREHGLLKVYRQLVFSTLITIGVYKTKMTGSILIDTEYVGYNKFIKAYIEKYISLLGSKNIPVIKFGFVGKESRSHYLAQSVLRRKKKANILVNADEILKLILANKKSGTT